jgi:hypothetical protein
LAEEGQTLMEQQAKYKFGKAVPTVPVSAFNPRLDQILQEEKAA